MWRARPTQSKTLDSTDRGILLLTLVKALSLAKLASGSS
jgi:hypothetical protein